MLTVEVDAVDASGWMSLSDLARVKNVSKQAISKRVSRLVDQKALTTREGERGALLVNLAEFDRAAGESTDLIRAQNGRQATKLAADGDPILTREQARRAAYAADMAELDLKERLGELMPVKDVERSYGEVAAATVEVIDQLSGYADAVAAAVARNGAMGARQELKNIARKMREDLARKLQQMGLSAQTQHDTTEPESQS